MAHAHPHSDRGDGDGDGHGHGHAHAHAHAHRHHHAPGRAHPPATIGPSILRMSAAGRLGVAAVLIVALWAATLWAMA